LRFPVQWVNRPHLDFRGFSGWVAGGHVAVGDRVTVLPGGQSSTVARIVTFDGDLEVATAGQAVTLTLADEIDVSRGDVLVGVGSGAKARQRIDTEVLWMHAQGLANGQRLLVKVGAKTVAGTIEAIHDRVNIETYDRATAPSLALNEIGRVTIALETPVVVAPYADDRELGAFILIDPMTNDTVALGTVRVTASPGGGLASRPAPVAARAKIAAPAPSRWARIGERGLEAAVLGAVAGVVAGQVAPAIAVAVAAFALSPLIARIKTMIAKARAPKGFEGDGI
jgi:sulfate adenylyltransferase subunit 1 (EFTu-like GTPase family)